MSTKKEYVKLWLSYAAYFQAYTPEEIGNIVLAMLRYKDTGEVPAFQGPERFIWPAIQRDIDEAQSAQEAAAEQSRENGRKGGRPRRAPPESQPSENPSGFSETQETIWTKDKDIDKGHCQGQGQGDGYARARERFAATDRLFAQILAEVKAEAAEQEAELPFYPSAHLSASASQMDTGSNSLSAPFAIPLARNST